MGWSAGLPSTAFKDLTFLEAAVKTDAAGLGAIEGSSIQKVSPQLANNVDQDLAPGERTARHGKAKGAERAPTSRSSTTGRRSSLRRISILVAAPRELKHVGAANCPVRVSMV